MAENMPIPPRRSNPVALLATVAVGLSLLIGGVLLRQQQDRPIRVVEAASQVVASTVTLQPSTATVVPATEQAVQVAEATSQPSSTATPPPPTRVPPPTPTSAPPTPTAIPASRVSVRDSYNPPAVPPPTAIPAPAEPIPVPREVVNILLLGSDIRPNDPGYRTDTIIVASVNKEFGTVSMLSFPRDLYVYIPDWTMARINTADAHGLAVGWPGGGPGLIRETLLYNFGIQTHFYARVDFDGFVNIVDTLGGIDVPVDCDFQDWKPVSFDLSLEELEDETNWELHTLPVGVHHLDGDMALWYARARKRTSDYDRARRQQQVLRSIWNQSIGLGWLQGPGSVTRLTSLWAQGNELIDTNMGLGNVLQFAPIAGNLDTSRIRSYFIGPGQIINWTTPDGSSVSLPDTERVQELVNLALRPPAANFANIDVSTVEVRNGTGVDRLDEVAADRLGWDGLIAIATGPADRSNYTETIIFDYKASLRGGDLYELQQSMRVPIGNVVTQPDPNRSVDYLVILGNDFAGRSCSPTRFVPTPVPVTPTATP